MLLVIVSGLKPSGLYGVTTLVYNVMYSTAEVLSFGAGQFAVVGGICTAWLVLDLHWRLWPGFIACLAAGGVFGWLSEIIAVRRIVAASDEHLWLLSTLALSTMGQEVMAIWWGTDPTPFPRVFPQVFAGGFDQRFWLPLILAVLRLLMLDEPSGGLAPLVIDRILDVARSLTLQGAAVLLVQQLVEKALAHADRC